MRVGSRAPSPQKLILEIASIAQDVTVSNVEAGVNAGASGNQDAVTLDQEMLSALPVLDRDLIATASRFLDPAALGSGVTIVVNGMEVSRTTRPGAGGRSTRPVLIHRRLAATLTTTAAAGRGCQASRGIR